MIMVHSRDQPEILLKYLIECMLKTTIEGLDLNMYLKIINLKALNILSCLCFIV